MDYWEWMTAIMVVLVLANLIRMNLWLMAIGQQLEYLYDKKVKEQQFQEQIYDRIYSQINKPQEKNNSQEIKEWDES
jgi:Tfp pilus assembly protein PilO